MELKINKTVLSITKGDLTEESTDAIVNAANPRLAGGGGVDGAIHAAGGPKIMEECRKYNGCPTGSAVITSGGFLKARHVIHTVGPVYRDGKHDEPRLLAGAYTSSLKLACEHGLKTVAFPSISTGAYGYPLKKASEAALKAVIDFIKADDRLEMVRFVLFSDSALDAYTSALEKLSGKRS